MFCCLVSKVAFADEMRFVAGLQSANPTSHKETNDVGESANPTPHKEPNDVGESANPTPHKEPNFAGVPRQLLTSKGIKSITHNEF
jgi:hypothetical protein